jgi:hypothetical protein
MWWYRINESEVTFVKDTFHIYIFDLHKHTTAAHIFLVVPGRSRTTRTRGWVGLWF